MPSEVQRLVVPAAEARGSASEQSDDSARRERSYAVLIRCRERVRDALEPYLGASCALERANNIAQALVFEDVEPHSVVVEMLRHVPWELKAMLVDLATHAWNEATN